ncbi:MAG: 2OG-Fe(II) oxygenase [Erythrobacter sp.]|nr:2OG-Fe(II) oxygenase [Erythrobacter sp.]
MAKVLATFVDPRHLTPAAMAAMRARFGQGENRHLVIDKFVSPQLLALLDRVVREEGEFEDNLKLASAARAPRDSDQQTPRGKVDAATFAAAPESDRFIRQKRLVGPRPGFEQGLGSKADRMVRQMLASQPLHQWLGAITGMALHRTGGINLKLHGEGHYLHPHSDARPGRQLCAVLYVHQAWDAAHGGEFVLHLADGEQLRFAPEPGRLVLFDVTQTNVHTVAPVTASDVWRVNYTAWFG